MILSADDVLLNVFGSSMGVAMSSPLSGCVEGGEGGGGGGGGGGCC